jgi:hypothetical protein
VVIIRQDANAGSTPSQPDYSERIANMCKLGMTTTMTIMRIKSGSSRIST